MRVFPFFLFFLFHFSHNIFSQTITNDSFHLVNSPYDEMNVVISPDGKTLFFTVANHPQNVGGKKDPGDIWFSEWVNNKWTSPVNAGLTLNNRAYNAVAGLSSDDSQLFLLSHYDPSGHSAKTQGLSYSQKANRGWQFPENIFISYFQNRSAKLSGHMTPDETIFVFSAESYGTSGVEDIYVSFYSDGKWNEPKNLGSKINTELQEISPSLSADGMTLYFSTNGRKGFGSFDVFSARRLDDTWTNWSEPENMGDKINSEGSELFFRSYPQFGISIFTTTTSSDGYGDIKIYSDQEPKKDTVTQVQQNSRDSVNAQSQIKERNLVTIFGKVINSKTLEPISATLNFSTPDRRNSVSSVGANGYSIQIPSSDVYSIQAESKGYISSIQKLDMQSSEAKELEMDFKLQPAESGVKVNLKNVLFEQGTANLLPESNLELDNIVSFLKSNPEIRIELSGHTDNRGVYADNIKLSQHRVNTVKEYIVAHGIEAGRITGKGYGGTRPVASNKDEESRKLNRRVEFTIKKN